MASREDIQCVDTICASLEETHTEEVLELLELLGDVFTVDEGAESHVGRTEAILSRCRVFEAVTGFFSPKNVLVDVKIKVRAVRTLSILVAACGNGGQGTTRGWNPNLPVILRTKVTSTGLLNPLVCFIVYGNESPKALAQRQQRDESPSSSGVSTKETNGDSNATEEEEEVEAIHNEDLELRTAAAECLFALLMTLVSGESSTKSASVIADLQVAQNGKAIRMLAVKALDTLTYFRASRWSREQHGVDSSERSLELYLWASIRLIAASRSYGELLLQNTETEHNQQQHASSSPAALHFIRRVLTCITSIDDATNRTTMDGGGRRNTTSSSGGIPSHLLPNSLLAKLPDQLAIVVFDTLGELSGKCPSLHATSIQCDAASSRAVTRLLDYHIWGGKTQSDALQKKKGPATTSTSKSSSSSVDGAGSAIAAFLMNLLRYEGCHAPCTVLFAHISSPMFWKHCLGAGTTTMSGVNTETPVETLYFRLKFLREALCDACSSDAIDRLTVGFLATYPLLCRMIVPSSSSTTTASSRGEDGGSSVAGTVGGRRLGGSANGATNTPLPPYVLAEATLIISIMCAKSPSIREELHRAFSAHRKVAEELCLTMVHILDHNVERSDYSHMLIVDKFQCILNDGEQAQRIDEFNAVSLSKALLHEQERRFKASSRAFPLHQDAIAFYQRHSYSEGFTKEISRLTGSLGKVILQLAMSVALLGVDDAISVIGAEDRSNHGSLSRSPSHRRDKPHMRSSPSPPTGGASSPAALLSSPIPMSSSPLGMSPGGGGGNRKKQLSASPSPSRIRANNTTVMSTGAGGGNNSYRQPGITTATATAQRRRQMQQQQSPRPGTASNDVTDTSTTGKPISSYQRWLQGQEERKIRRGNKGTPMGSVISSVIGDRSTPPPKAAFCSATPTKNTSGVLNTSATSHNVSLKQSSVKKSKMMMLNTSNASPTPVQQLNSSIHRQLNTSNNTPTPRRGAMNRQTPYRDPYVLGADAIPIPTTIASLARDNQNSAAVDEYLSLAIMMHLLIKFGPHYNRCNKAAIRKVESPFGTYVQPVYRNNSQSWTAEDVLVGEVYVLFLPFHRISTSQVMVEIETIRKHLFNVKNLLITTPTQQQRSRRWFLQDMLHYILPKTELILRDLLRLVEDYGADDIVYQLGVIRLMDEQHSHTSHQYSPEELNSGGALMFQAAVEDSDVAMPKEVLRLSSSKYKDVLHSGNILYALRRLQEHFALHDRNRHDEDDYDEDVEPTSETGGANTNRSVGPSATEAASLRNHTNNQPKHVRLATASQKQHPHGLSEAAALRAVEAEIGMLAVEEEEDHDQNNKDIIKKQQQGMYNTYRTATGNNRSMQSQEDLLRDMPVDTEDDDHYDEDETPVNHPSTKTAGYWEEDGARPESLPSHLRARLEYPNDGSGDSATATTTAMMEEFDALYASAVDSIPHDEDYSEEVGGKERLQEANDVLERL